MEENMRTRTGLLLSAAAVGLLLTGASAQTLRDEQPRGNQAGSQDTRPQGSQVDRIQDPSRQRAEPQPQNRAPAQSNAQAQPQGQPPQQQSQPQQPAQPQQQQAQPQPQGAPNAAPARPSTGQNQQPAPSGQAPAASAPQNRQPAATAQQPAQTQPGSTAQQPAQTQQPAQSQPRQTGQSQPAQNNAAPGAQQRSSGVAEQRSTGVVSLSTQQQSQIGQTIARHNVRPLTNVNFSISVGTRVPRSVTLRALSSDLVTFVPQYRGYSYFVVEEQIVIVEPSSLEIVSIVPYASTSKTVTSKSGSGGKAMTNRPVKLSTEQRDVVRKHATERRVSSERKASATVRRSYQPGDRVDREVTIETFPETVYTEVPSIRRYRYFRNDDDVLLVDPDEDRVVDVIR
jgi:hypothetical protein